MKPGPRNNAVDATGAGHHAEDTRRTTVTCPSCKGPLATAITRTGLAMHPGCDPLDVPAAGVVNEALSIVTDAIDNAPRSRQSMIGPSELGTPCDRRLSYGLAQVPRRGSLMVPWRPFVGTAMHEAIGAAIATHEIDRFATDHGATPRWRVEERVTVGQVDGVDVTGSCDLFDSWTAVVIDWKTTSPVKITRYKATGPGEQYRIQAHLYGRGWQLAGHAVRHVALVFLPRDGDVEKRYTWTEPYDEQVAVDALDRASRIAASTRLLGLGFTAAALPTADAYCGYCPWLNTATDDISRGCPGHRDGGKQPTQPTAGNSLADLLTTGEHA